MKEKTADIDILEEKIKIIESLCTDDCINKETVIKPFKYAISNLIAENKELKEKKKNMLETYKKINPEKMKVLADSFNEKVMSKLESDYISKPVIEKKIEELEDIKIKTQRLYPHTYTAIGEWLEAHYKINILQEILDERNNINE